MERDGRNSDGEHALGRPVRTNTFTDRSEPQLSKVADAPVSVLVRTATLTGGALVTRRIARSARRAGLTALLLHLMTRRVTGSAR
jgi:hypothetical protein